jgi:hypothetical protein
MDSTLHWQRCRTVEAWTSPRNICMSNSYLPEMFLQKGKNDFRTEARAQNKNRSRDQRTARMRELEKGPQTVESVHLLESGVRLWGRFLMNLPLFSNSLTKISVFFNLAKEWLKHLHILRLTEALRWWAAVWSIRPAPWKQKKAGPDSEQSYLLPNASCITPLSCGRSRWAGPVARPLLWTYSFFFCFPVCCFIFFSSSCFHFISYFYLFLILF